MSDYESYQRAERRAREAIDHLAEIKVRARIVSQLVDEQPATLTDDQHNEIDAIAREFNDTIMVTIDRLYNRATDAHDEAAVRLNALEEQEG